MTEILRYAAFTTDPAGGNKAGVVPAADGLTDEQMLAIAAELGYSESAFLTELGERHYRVRYFAPAMEVPFCGHATIATAVALGELTGPGDLVFETGAGTVPVTVAAGPDGVLRATLTSVEPHTEPVSPADLAEALAALGWSEAELNAELPPRIAYAGARHRCWPPAPGSGWPTWTTTSTGWPPS